MSDKALPVVPYERDRHEAAFFRFVEKVLGKEKCDLRRRVVDSIHESMPGRDRLPLRHVIMDGDRVAGSMGHLPADFLVNGQPTPARFTHDLLVDPDYRGRGLARLVVDHVCRLGDFFPGGMWMTEPCYKIHMACGFEAVTPLTTHTLVFDPAAFIARKGMSGFRGSVGKIGLALARSRSLKRAANAQAKGGASLKMVDHLDPALDPRWKRLATSYEITRLRDASYLNWKYAQHPNLDYTVLLAERAGDPAGYMVWRNAPEGAAEKRAVVADFLVEKGDAEALRLLLSATVIEAFRSRMHYLSVLATQPWAVKIFRSFGFFPRGERNTWVIAGWKKVLPPSSLTNHDAWHICLGDSDGDMWTGSQ